MEISLPGCGPDSTPFRRAPSSLAAVGSVGSHLCDLLLDSGVDVVCVDNFLTSTADNVVHRQPDDRFELLIHDVTDPISIPGDVDLVLHLASPASPQDYLRLPVETLQAGSLGTFNALEVAREKQARFVLASTSEVYGDPLQHPQRESYRGNVNPVGPRSVYDEAKPVRGGGHHRLPHQARCRHRNRADLQHLRAADARERTGTGRFRPSSAKRWPLSRLQSPATDRRPGHCAHVHDTVRAILAVAAGSHPGPVNLGNPAETTVLELAHLVRELSCSAAPIEFIDRPADDPGRRRPDIALAWEQFGWKPETDLRKGLSTTIDWFATQLNDTAARER
ncbi:UDP-glucose 4-epimerase [Streptomyces alboniger]